MELGAFQLEERIGRGAMGDVWSATHRRDETKAAIKVITAAYASRDDYQRQFRNEIRSAAALNHPGIVRVYDYGEVDRDAAAASGLALRPDSPYFAMELTGGGSVDAMESEIGWPELRGLLVGLLQALGHAHARGVIHRDLKPSNVLLGEDLGGEPRYKISDFGLAFDRRKTRDSDRSLDGAVGTPHYMAPEQLRSRWRDIGPWTDLYSLGCMTWRLATGDAPFRGNALLEVAKAHMTEPLPDFEPRFTVPEDFENWLARLLEKHPHDRFRRSADALWSLLELPEKLERNSSAPLEVEEAATVARTRVTEPLESLADGTRVDRSGAMATPEPRETMVPEHSGDSPRSIEPIDRELPPVPGDWQQRRPPDETPPRMTAGQELFSLRDFPTVGRDEVRDALWDALRTVTAEQSTRLVLLRGDAGVGKTRLARWLRERAEEVGATVGFAASHDPESRDGGLADVINTHLALAGLERDEALTRAEQWYASRGVDRSYEARAIVEYVLESDHDELPTATLQKWRGESPTEGFDAADEPEPPDRDSDARANPEGVEFSSVHEIRALVRRFFECAAEERPLVVCLDDLQWGLETLKFLDYLLGSSHSDGLPVLFVGTIREDTLAERPLEERVLEAIEQHPETKSLAIGPMSTTDQRFLVEHLLHLEPGAAERIVDRAGGNPLYAVELVRDWIDREVLEPTDLGFAVAEEADPRMPEDLYDIWNDRLLEFTGSVDERQGAALQLGALLGEEIDRREWQPACEAADLPFPDPLVEQLLRHNLLRETDTGWRLAHSLLRETLVQSAKESTRWEQLNRACSEAVGPDISEPDDAERLARYLLEAGRRERALEPMLDAVESYDLRTRYRKARDLFEIAESIAGELSLEDRPELAAQFYLVSGRVAYNADTDCDSADRAFEHALDATKAADLPALQSRVMAERTIVAVHRNKFDRALDWATSAAELVDDDSGFAALRVSYLAASAAERAGDFELADHYYQAAVERAGRSHLVERTKYLVEWARCLRAHSEPGAAREKAEEAMRLGEELGHNVTRARAANLLGEIARVEDDLSAARHWYRRAEQFAKLVDAAQLFPVFLGRVQIELGEQNYERAIRILENVDQRTRERRRVWFEMSFFALKAHAEAGLGDWSATADTEQSVRETLNETVPRGPGAAKGLQRAAELAADQGRDELARRFARDSHRLWSELDASRAEQAATELAEHGIEFDP